jgi:hypothetical protein
MSSAAAGVVYCLRSAFLRAIAALGQRLVVRQLVERLARDLREVRIRAEQRVRVSGATLVHQDDVVIVLQHVVEPRIGHGETRAADAGAAGETEDRIALAGRRARRQHDDGASCSRRSRGFQNGPRSARMVVPMPGDGGSGGPDARQSREHTVGHLDPMDIGEVHGRAPRADDSKSAAGMEGDAAVGCKGDEEPAGAHSVRVIWTSYSPV